MHKAHDDSTYAGCDACNDTLDVVRHTADERTAHRRFNNTTAGHNQLIPWLGQTGQPVRVVVEASGIYRLDLALALHLRKAPWHGQEAAGGYCGGDAQVTSCHLRHAQARPGFLRRKILPITGQSRLYRPKSLDFQESV